MKIFRTTLALVALAIIPLSAMAEEITFYTGGKGGGYDKASHDIAARLAQRGHTVTIENRNGSDDITLQACGDDDAAMWIAQKDALYIREMTSGCILPEVAIYGTEYAMLFFPPDSRLNELSDLGESHSILVDKIGSGSELSLRTMINIEKEHGRSDAWTKVGIETSPYTRASSMASRGTVDAVFLVRTLASDDITRLLRAGWTLGELYDKDINDLKWNGNPLYNAEKVAIIRDGRRVGKDWAYEVPSLIGTNESVEYDSPELFDDMINAAQ